MSANKTDYQFLRLPFVGLAVCIFIGTLAFQNCGGVSWNRSSAESASSIDTEPQPTPPDVPAQAKLTVAEVYTANSDWMSYVKNNGPTPYTASNTSCVAADAIYYSKACIHGGEKRKVQVPEFRDCAAKSMDDTLNAFNWVCVPGTPVTFYSTGLKQGKGLRDLIDFSTGKWRPNAVNARENGVVKFSSEAKIWWSNPVTPLPPNATEGAGLSLSSPGTIYYLSADRDTAGYNIIASRIAVVTAPGVRLHWNNSTIDYCSSGHPGFMCVLSGSNVNFLWIEANIAAALLTDQRPGDNGLWFDNVRVSRFHGIRTQGTGIGSYGAGPFNCFNCFSNLFTSIASTASMHNGIVSFDQDALLIQGGGYNVLQDILVYESVHGLMFMGSTSNIATRVIANNHRAHGVSFESNATSNIVTHLTSAQNSTAAVAMYNNADMNEVVNGLLTNSNHGVVLYTATNANVNNAKLRNLMISNMGSTEIIVGLSDNNHFGGFIAVETCYLEAGSLNPGLTSTCGPQGTSAFIRLTGANNSNSFVGPISVDDPVNVSDQNGTYPVINVLVDWVGLSNSWRTWGRFDSTVGSALHPNFRGNQASGGAVNIFDWSLKISDVFARNTSGNGSSINVPWTTGGICPSAVGGNIAHTPNSGPAFLSNAVEILADDIGDDDGLCESNEACMYSPNIGAYQGHGPVSNESCVFENGLVTGVKIYRYPSNGF